MNLGDTELMRQLPQRRMRCPYLSHVVICQLAQSCVRRPRARPATLGQHVGRVVLMRAQEQVIRATARRVVAAMQDDLTVRDRPVVDDPRGPVRAHRAAFIAADPLGDHAISALILDPEPWPAAVRICRVNTLGQPDRQGLEKTAAPQWLGCHIGYNIKR